MISARYYLSQVRVRNPFLIWTNRPVRRGTLLCVECIVYWVQKGPIGYRPFRVLSVDCCVLLLLYIHPRREGRKKEECWGSWMASPHLPLLSLSSTQLSSAIYITSCKVFRVDNRLHVPHSRASHFVDLPRRS
jgi:hypothetical protein